MRRPIKLLLIGILTRTGRGSDRTNQILELSHLSDIKYMGIDRGSGH